MDTIYTEAHRRLINALKEARVAAGLTQAQVADHLGRPQPAVSQLESGNRRVDVIELAQLCTLYGLDMLDFLSDLNLQDAVSRKRRPKKS